LCLPFSDPAQLASSLKALRSKFEEEQAKSLGQVAALEAGRAEDAGAATSVQERLREEAAKAVTMAAEEATAARAATSGAEEQLRLRDEALAQAKAACVDVAALREETTRFAREAAEHLEELQQVKRQNTELRAKVIRQDAAWKRKIESERKRVHVVDLPGRRQVLGDAAANAQGDEALEGGKQPAGRIPCARGSDLVKAMRRSGGARRETEEPKPSENIDTAWA
jgi:hypothetical protein